MYASRPRGESGLRPCVHIACFNHLLLLLCVRCNKYTNPKLLGKNHLYEAKINMLQGENVTQVMIII
jgi:hypothetical protein